MTEIYIGCSLNILLCNNYSLTLQAIVMAIKGRNSTESGSKIKGVFVLADGWTIPKINQLGTCSSPAHILKIDSPMLIFLGQGNE